MKNKNAQLLAEKLQNNWKARVPKELRDEIEKQLKNDSELQANWYKLLLASNIVPLWCQNDIHGLFAKLCAGQMDTIPDKKTMQTELRTQLANIDNEADLKQRLRIFRSHTLAGIIWREATGKSDFKHTTAVLSNLADISIAITLEILNEWANKTWGKPKDSAQGLLVLALGKLGGVELNLSSDVDLIFIYAQDGQCEPPTAGGKTALGNVLSRSLSYRQYYTLLAQKLIQIIDEQTREGFVFRVDLLLRPFGKSGALVSNLAGIEQYYENYGRDWERYMLIKMRPVAGSKTLFQELKSILDHFVFRRYIDFSVVKSLRDMQRKILTAAVRQGKHDDIKLGIGCIRHMELVIQTLQLVHGGKVPQLRQNSFLGALEAISQANLLPPETVHKLSQAYVFMRNLEHRVQAKNDKQTHSWPQSINSRNRLAWSLGFVDAEALHDKWTEYRQDVTLLSEKLFGVNLEQTDDISTSLWQAAADKADFVAECRNLKTTKLEGCGEFLGELWHRKKFLPTIVNDRLDAVMPKVITLLLSKNNSRQVLSRVTLVIMNLLRRSAYLCLLSENQKVLSHLVDLCGQSGWITNHLSLHPQLLDEFLYVNMSPISESATLHHNAQDLTKTYSLELGMKNLRLFKASYSLNTAIADLDKSIPLEQVSNHLSWIAESVLEASLRLCWNDLTKVHGFPNKNGEEPQLCIIGYGKLGGLELGYGSDLDLIFVHNDQLTEVTTGKKPIINALFYNRLIRRLINILTVLTTEGRLYKIDMRLRPSGESGALINALHALQKYYHNQSWVWEHQSLVRARPVAGNTKVADDFVNLRHKILRTPRARKVLQINVRNMRERIAKDQLQNKKFDAQQLEKTLFITTNNAETKKFDPKHIAGGIIDIEFIVQYLVLGWASEFPQLTTYTDNIRILQTLNDTQLLQKHELNLLHDTYMELRAITHRNVLTNQTLIIEHGLLEKCQQIELLWRRLMQ